MAGLAGEVDVVITHFPPALEAIGRALYEGNQANPYFARQDGGGFSDVRV